MSFIPDEITPLGKDLGAVPCPDQAMESGMVVRRDQYGTLLNIQRAPG